MKNANIWLVILSFIFPIVGIILFFVKKNEDAEAAQSYLYAGIASIVLGLILAL